MASIPAQFADPSLSGQLVSARLLNPLASREDQLLRSGIDSLDRHFAAIRPGDLIEERVCGYVVDILRARQILK